jgi:hypothetical protein
MQVVSGYPCKGLSNLQWLIPVLTEDASVAFFNPAGISFIPSKLSVAAGALG